MPTSKTKPNLGSAFQLWAIRLFSYGPFGFSAMGHLALCRIHFYAYLKNQTKPWFGFSAMGHSAFQLWAIWLFAGVWLFAEYISYAYLKNQTKPWFGFSAMGHSAFLQGFGSLWCL